MTTSTRKGIVGRKKDPKTRVDMAAEGCLVAPSWLTGAAREVFFDVAEMQTKEFDSGEIDSHAVAMYAHQYALYVSLADCETTKQHGLRTMPHPDAIARQKALDMCLKYQKELGMTPKARAALPVKVGDEKDEFSDYE